MMSIFRIAAALMFAVAGAGVMAQAQDAATDRDAEQLKIAALEALISAPPERALPIVAKVLRGNGSEELKEGALFLLSQIDAPEARDLLIETARSSDSESLRHEAIRMMGIGGMTELLSGFYADSDADTREAVLEAWLIAGDEEAVYRVAADAKDRHEFAAAVEVLGAMGATEKLRALRNRADMSESLIEAYAIAGDSETLRELATDDSDPERQAHAIEGLAMIGDDDIGEMLVAIYASTGSPTVKDAVREGLLITGDDETVLQLFRQSRDNEEKAELLEMLVMMDSDAVWDIVDATLENRSPDNKPQENGPPENGE